MKKAQAESKIITVENLHNHTSQEVFDFLSRNLINQSQRCTDGKRNLLIHKVDNKILHCAVGFLIPPHIYKEEFEGKRYSELNKIFSQPHEKLIEHIQSIHDVYDPKHWFGCFLHGTLFFKLDNSNLLKLIPPIQ